MDGDSRTIWCGNLSEKVTEDILYELFLQGGPLERVTIPKDRDGKQRSYGFITYKHVSSVPYALELFHGTLLHNRAISLKSRIQLEVPRPPPIEKNIAYNELIELGNQMIIGNCMPLAGLPFDNPYPQPLMQYHQANQINSSNQYLGSSFPYNDDRRSHRSHPYNREQERHNNRYNNDHGRDNRREHYSSSTHRDKYRDEHRDSHRPTRHDSRRNHRS